jgi:uncharacterized protein
MRYFNQTEREAKESRLIAANFGKRFEPLGTVDFAPDVQLDAAGVELIPLDGQILAIAPDTASWAFLSPEEATLFRGLISPSRTHSVTGWPETKLVESPRFVGAMYRRGLLSINGEWALDLTLFDDSPNCSESHLVELLLTEKCNLACGYCLAGTNARMPTMTGEVATRAIDLAFAMEEARAFAFEFSGGEPMMRFEHMRELARYIRRHPARGERSVTLHIQTNATLLTEEKVRWLKANHVRVGVSIDGGPETQDVSRPMLGGQGSFRATLRGIDLLQSHEVPFGVLVVLNRANGADPEPLVSFLLDNDIRSIKLNPIAYLGTARTGWGAFGLESHEVIEYFTRFANLLVELGEPLVEDNLRTMMVHLVSKQRPTRCLRTHCGAGETFQAISANGDIYPCGRATQSPGLRIGNVLTEGRSLSAASRTNLPVLEIKNRRPRDLEGCVICAYRQLCQAGCSAQAFERYGTVRHRTPECDFFKTLYPYLMRWLSFDADALQYFEKAGYFDGPIHLETEDLASRASLSQRRVPAKNHRRRCHV